MKTFLPLLLLALPAFAAPPATPAPSPSASPSPSAAAPAAARPSATATPAPSAPAAPSASPTAAASAAPSASPIAAAPATPAPTPVPPPAAPNWTVLDAPYRIILKLREVPKNAEAGIEINLQDNGQMRPDLADLVLTDRAGAPQPLAKLAYRPGGRIILLAQKLTPDTPYYLYFGGNKPRISPEWSPKTSVLMETRPAPKDLKFDSLQSLKTAWSQSPEAPGAGFVGIIYHGGNPFGSNANFLTHYIGYLQLPAARNITFYTLSSDCSFVVINDQIQFGWPGQHSAHAEPNTVVKKTVPLQAGLVKIEYYAAKGANDSDARLGAATVLGWQTGTGFEAIPPEQWLHPGNTNHGTVQTRDNQFLALPKATVQSYAACNGQWLYETRFELQPPQWVKNSAATWEFADGASVTGTAITHLLAGNDSQTVRCKWTHGNIAVDVPLRVDIPEHLQRASINSAADVRRYLDRIDEEAALKLRPDAVRLRLAFLAEFGTDREVAKFSEQLPRDGENDVLWLTSRLASVRALGQTDPAAAKQAFWNLMATLQPATAQQFGALIAETEIDLLVFLQRDPEAFGRLTQIGFINRATPEFGRTLKIRIGDLHRILGHTKEAINQYRSVTPAQKDPALAVKDSAASLAIRDLLEKGACRDAETKLLQWERRRPMCKYDSDFLLLRARTWIAMGRWAEARTELESFQKIQPDNPFQLDAKFYQARILFEQGNKDEARKIWTAFASDYPRHPLAAEAAQWAKKQ